MPETVAQGPVSGVTGQTETSQSKAEGKTAEPAPETKTEGASSSQDTESGRAKTDKGTSKPKKPPEPSATPEESFLGEFDPQTLPEELRPAYEKLDKQFKAAYTKKTQAMSGVRQKADAYDAFVADPINNLRKVAESYGMDIKPRSANPGDPTSGIEPFGTNWQPQTWGEVRDALTDHFVKAMSQKFAPVFDNLQQLTTKSIESQLMEIDPNWRLYEDDMSEMLKSHPTLAKDVGKLYRIAVPEEVLKSKYTQEALRRFEEKAASAKVAGKSSVQSSQAAPSNKRLTFDEAVKMAKKQLGM